MKRHTYKRWSSDEEAFLAESIERVPLPKIARRLKRNPLAVRAKAQRMGLSVRPTLDHYSMRYLAASLGVDFTTVRWWVQKGYLKATPNGVRRLAISAKAFTQFCQKRPDIVSKFDPELLDWLCHNNHLTETATQKEAQP